MSISIAVCTITDMFLILKRFNIDLDIRTILKNLSSFWTRNINENSGSYESRSMWFFSRKNLEYQSDQEFFGRVLNLLPDSIVISNSQQNILFMNPAAE
jgi:PAS domain-containing protein